MHEVVESKTTERQTLYTLQAGRAFAALLIVLFHNSFYIFALDKYWGSDPTHGIFKFSHAGVHFFFVLSGFIITHAHWRDLGRSSTLPKYLLKRFVRIYPFYWLVLTGTLAIYFLIPSFGQEYHRQATTIISSYLLIPISAEAKHALAVAWTLHHEILFYCIFALAILNKRLGLAALVIWLAASFYSIFINQSAFPFSFLAAPINTLFGMGALSCWLVRCYRIKHPIIFALCGLIVFSATAYDDNYDIYLSKDIRDLMYGIASSLIIIGFVRLELQNRIKIPDLLKRIGDASYAIYLTHFMILSVSAKVFISTGASKLLPDIISYILLALIAVMAGLMIHFFLERPMLRIISGIIHKKNSAGA